MKKKLFPMYDYVLVKPLTREKVGSLYVAPQYTERYQEGEVVETGEGKLMWNGAIAPMKVKYGDIVMFDSGGGFKIEAEKEVFYVLREQEIIARVEITNDETETKEENNTKNEI